MEQKLTRHLPDIKIIFVFLVIWGIAIVFVGPEGDFPLNDDWAYARGVESLVTEGQLKLDKWPAMTLLAQIGIGTVYCKVFGFSFEVLRWSTLINSFFCICLFYFLVRKFARIPVAFFVSLLLFFNPLFFALSFTFMTEVHFTMVMIAAMLFFSNYLESSKYSYLILGGLFSLIAVMIRQHGILIPLSFGLVLLYREKTISRRLAALLPFIICFICLKVYQNWLILEHPYIHKVGGFKKLLYAFSYKELEHLIWSVINLILLPGLFLLPLVILLLPSINWKELKTNFIALISILFAGCFLAYHLDIFPPGNMIYNLGLGPKVIKGAWDPSPKINDEIWMVLDYISLAGVIGLLLLLIQNIGLKFKSFFTQKEVSHLTLIKWSLALFCCAYFLVINLMSSFFDRYALPFIPCLAILILPQNFDRIKRYTPAAICLVFIALYSVLGTHDYLSWNRARNEAFNYLYKEEGIPITCIDAGIELNGWYNDGTARYGKKKNYRSWWFITEDDYVLAFKNLKSFETWKAYPFPTLLPIGTDTFYILKKEYINEIDYKEFPISSDLERRSHNKKVFHSNHHPTMEFGKARLQVKGRARSGESSVKLTPEYNEGIVAKFWHFKTGDRIKTTVWRYPAGSNTEIIAESNYQKTFTEVSSKVIKEENGWEQIQSVVTVPPYSGIDRIRIFVRNNSDEAVWLDDIEINREKQKK